MVRETAISILSAAIATAIGELRFRHRQKKALIKEIAEKFLELRKGGTHENVYELRALQCSGILLLKSEKDAIEVLERIELLDKPIRLVKQLEQLGVLKGLRSLIDNNIDLDDFRDITIAQIRHMIQNSANS